MRLFVSVELTDEIKKNIAGLIAELKSRDDRVKWVEAKNLHLTLKFIGEVAEQQLAELVGRVAEKIGGHGNFKIKLAGTGTFPEGKHPRVIWVGVSEGSDRLEELAHLLAEGEFASHVTIGRIKDEVPRGDRDKGVDKLKEKLAVLKDSKFGEVSVGSIFIMRSTLTPKGPIYEKIKEVKL